jgi:SAM-dependent methyltransferase
MSDQWDAKKYIKDASFVPKLGADVWHLLDPQPSESILDLGCGDGALTKKIKDAGCHVVGIDNSQSMINAAKKQGIEAYCISGEKFSFNNKFDAVFSNAALHWMKNSQAVIENVYTVLKDGGRFIGEFGGHGNVCTVRTAIHDVLSEMGIDPTALDPWYFPRHTKYEEELKSAGFNVEFINIFNRPTIIPGDISAWLEIFAVNFCVGMTPNTKKQFIRKVVSRVRPALQNKEGTWVLDYVRLQFKAIKADKIK